MFLPDTAEDTLKLISEDVTMTIYGIIMAIEVRIQMMSTDYTIKYYYSITNYLFFTKCNRAASLVII